jgi:hypothetical protein
MDDRALVGLAHVWQWKVAELSFPYAKKSSTLIVMMLIVNTIFPHVYESKRMLFNKVFISSKNSSGEIKWDDLLIILDLIA